MSPRPRFRPFAAALALGVALAAGALAGAAPAAAFPTRGFDHAAFDTLLTRYVRGTNVAYAEWHANAADRATLAAYVARLADADTTGWPRGEQVAFWINAYNAITLARVLEAYPVASITKIKPTLGVLPGNGVWKEPHRVAGRTTSLDEIEHGVLRKYFGDARVHFAINCASKSCPPLAPRAYVGRGLDATLDMVTRRFVHARKYNVIVPGQPWVLSKIFEWYADDFTAAAGSVPAFVIRNLPLEETAGLDPAKVQWSTAPYDWSLNEP